jgi:hypothetical protein
MSALASQSPVLPTLAAQALPRRVRDLLNSVLKVVSGDLERGVAGAIREFEQQLYRQIESSMDNSLGAIWQLAQDKVGHSRADILLHFMNALEAELANLQDPQVVRGHLQARYHRGDELALVNDLEIEETSTLTDAATRAELQHSLQLFLLGQRFGVLAGRPAFDVEILPIGPQALCRSIRRATDRLELDVEARLLFYRAFERQVMPLYGNLVEAINADLARNGVLPHLQYVPVRARRTEQKSGAGSNPKIVGRDLTLADSSDERTARGAHRNRSGSFGGTGGNAIPPDLARQATELLMAMASGQGDIANDQAYGLLRQLMSSRRQLLGKLNPDRSRDGREAPHVVGAADLQEALRGMQHRPIVPVIAHGRATPRNVGHLKQDMLALLRRVSPNQEAPALSEEHNDALDLVGMLYDNLMKDVKPGSTAATLLSKMQVPLMRVALQDSGFFTRHEHPARQMLNTIAETSSEWLADDNDDALAKQMHSIVDRAVQEYKGDPAVFQGVLQDLITHLQTLSRKAEVAERRHVEAARGKEKLTLARENAAAAVESLVKGRKLPRFTRTMLSQAWTDVMALTALRHGEDSLVWKRQLQVAERLIEIAGQPAGDHPDTLDPENNLQREIEEGLTKVGYQGPDVVAIARRLVNPNETGKDDGSTRTELTMRLKAQARLGEEMPGKKARRIPLTSAEEAEMVRIQQSPPGTWFEFVINPQGDRVRRRLSWLSTATGEALFVNKRGQKNAEYTLDSLARLLAKGQVAIVEEDKTSAIDRAWENVLNALRSFAVPESEETAK